jgi:hypothetical protein
MPARVFLYEYNASPAVHAAATKLDDHAAKLLVCLHQKRRVGSCTQCVFNTDPISREERSSAAPVSVHSPQPRWSSRERGEDILRKLARDD